MLPSWTPLNYTNLDMCQSAVQIVFYSFEFSFRISEYFTRGWKKCQDMLAIFFCIKLKTDVFERWIITSFCRIEQLDVISFDFVLNQPVSWHWTKFCWSGLCRSLDVSLKNYKIKRLWTSSTSSLLATWGKDTAFCSFFIWKTNKQGYIFTCIPKGNNPINKAKNCERHRKLTSSRHKCSSPTRWKFSIIKNITTVTKPKLAEKHGCFWLADVMQHLKIAKPTFAPLIGQISTSLSLSLSWSPS